MQIKTKLLNTNFNNKGWDINFEDFIPKKILSSTSIQGYFVSNQETNIICIKGLICLVTFDLDDSDLNEFFIGDLNRLQVCIPRNVAFAWTNISCYESLILSDLNDVKMTIDTHDEDKQISMLGFSIPYQF